MKTKLFLGMLTAAATLAVAPAVFADDEPVVNSNFKIEYQRGDLAGDGKSFTGTSYTTDGTAGNYTLELPEGNVYFTGEEGSSLTITSITCTGSSSSGAYTTTDSFIVEGTTVTISDVTADLGLNLSIGTMESATLVITNGSNISTGAYLNTVGSTMATGTITIEDNSTLSTQQITLGGGISSLFGVSGTTEGSYWVQYLISDTDREAVITALTTAYQKEAKVSYGIVNVNSGSTWNVGVGNTDSSTNKLQVSNGEINISGGQLFMSDGSGLVLQGESEFATDYGKSYVTGVNFSQSITVTNGGSVSTSESGDGMFELVLGNSWYASNSTTDVLVSGNNSSFDVTANTKYSNDYIGIYIGTNSGTWTADGTTQIYDGGTVDVDIKATDSGVFKVSTLGGIYVAADNYYDYLTSSTADNSGHSYGLTVAFTAASGGSLTLEAVRDSTNRSSSTSNMDGVIYLGVGSAATGTDNDGNNLYTNTITATATGTDSQLVFSAYTIYTNYQSGNLATSFVAEKGGTLTFQVDRQIVFGFETSGSNNSVEVKADGGTVLITGADDVYTNYLSGDLTSSFGAYNGGELKIEASNEVAFGVGRDPTTKAYDNMAGGTTSITADGSGSKVEISASKSYIFINYETQGMDSTVTASNGGYISMTSNEINIGYGSSTRQYEGNIDITATGSGSKIEIIAVNEVAVNQQTIDGSTTTFLAEDGGYIYIGTTSTTAAASASVYFGWASLSSSTDGKTIGGDIEIKATGAGSTIEISANKNIYANSTSVTNAKTYITASDGGKLIFKAGANSQFNIGTEISIMTGGSLTTTATVFNSGSSISIDGTSKWTGGDAQFASGSSLSITAGESAIAVLDEASANVSLGKVTISDTNVITVTIDISSLDNYTEASVAILTAESIIFGSGSGTTLVAGSTITGTNYSSTLDTFVTEYITLTEGDFTLDSWSYVENNDSTYTLYANIRTLPEPSMFGLFAGLMAIGLVSTRRRRRKA